MNHVNLKNRKSGHFVFEEKIEHQKIDAASLDYFRQSLCS